MSQCFLPFCRRRVVDVVTGPLVSLILVSLILLPPSWNLVEASAFPVVVNFGVLLPKQPPNPISQDYCGRLDSARIETSLIDQRLQEQFGWSMMDSESNAEDRPVRVKLNMNYYDSECSDTYGPFAAMEIYYGNRQQCAQEAQLSNGTSSVEISAFYGPCCKYALSPVGRYAKLWNVPVITSGGLTHAFANRTSFPLLVRTFPPYKKLADFLVELLSRYKWHHTALLYHENIGAESKAFGSSNCYHMMDAINQAIDPSEHLDNFDSFDGDYDNDDDDDDVESLPDGVDSVDENTNGTSETETDGSAGHEFEIPHRDFFNEHYLPSFDLGNILNNTGLRARIVILCASPATVRKIMIKAAEQNFDNGEYVFFNIDLFSSQSKLEKPWYDANDTDDRNRKARSAYESLMTITLRKPDSKRYTEFSKRVKEIAQQQYGDTEYGDGEVNSFVGAFHDAVILYALALNETLAAGLDPKNGTDITRRMWNRTFEGITGTVSIDETGDRNADYSLLDMNPETGLFEVVANYYGDTKQYVKEEGKNIHWGGGRTSPPPDKPECGFDGSGCPKEEPFPAYGIVSIVLGSMLFVLLTAVFLVYRHYKLEAALAEVNWRIRWDDIMFGAQEKRKLERSGSRLSLARRDSGSMNSVTSVDTIAYHLSNIGSKQIFTKTGSYKSTLVAIKKINRSINVTKPLLMEFKRMRDLQNDHIVRFIGVCIDAPNQCLLTEYCQKGSLQDVLENDQIKLDSMFKFSLIQDIVRGMAYLHSSEIRSHGNLKSSNCVVDSRFVLKLTDFGLPALRGHDDLHAEQDSYVYYRSKLWTAPELLRLVEIPFEGTQKGDVYSFAIICQEIIYRNGPFWLDSMDMSPHEIYKMVKNGQKPFFRPTLLSSQATTASGDEEYEGCSSEELLTMIRRCWTEDPTERPDFHALKTIIKRINKDGDCSGNLLDNLLSRMEQYAYNLEGLVEARTADYLEQKKKAEDLLYMMLPRSVAVQLMHGQTVKAEKFEGVSIYFSDICGFTSMSAESTPMQVVDFLNDLYTTFDSVIDLFDVYKVETIGDAYMVVSGLPVRNGILHAREIARMAISLLNAVKSFKIRHRPHDQLKLRIGIHSGPVCAGIVGLKMPRYCLFGDTVNTASRMESNGEALKIHVSPQTKELLDSFDTFVLQLRGAVAMKGKGEIVTWWLIGENNPDFPDLAPPTSAANEVNSEKCEFKIY